MKARPILFSAPMVRAILAGTKTQTRRVVKPQPFRSNMPSGWSVIDRKGGVRTWSQMLESSASPYGQPGDRLWVREAWAKTHCLGHEMFVYRVEDNRTDYGGPWKPSIHMPRQASRITLKIVSVRVERLQDISEADCRAEGLGDTVDRAHHWYQVLWEQINGPGSWDANPWVWVVEFKRVMP